MAALSLNCFKAETWWLDHSIIHQTPVYPFLQNHVAKSMFLIKSDLLNQIKRLFFEEYSVLNWYMKDMYFYFLGYAESVVSE